jgi:chromosome segregation ATPase
MILERAKKLKEEVAKEQAVYKGILSVVGQAADIALIATPTTDPATKIGKLSAAVGSLGRLADLVGEIDPRLKEAENLEAEAARIHIGNAVKKLNAAKQYLRDLKGQLADIQSKLPGYRETVNNTRATVEASYDQAIKTQKTNGRFNFDSLRKALAAAQTSVETTRKTYEMAYGVRENIRQISAHGGDDANWMAFPGEARKVIGAMYEESKPVFDWAVKERPIAEALLKRLGEMYAVANNSMQ